MRSNGFPSHPSSPVPHPSLIGTAIATRRSGLDFLILSCLCRTLADRLGFFFCTGDGIADGHRGADRHLARLDRRGGAGKAPESRDARRGDFYSALARLQKI